MNETAKEATSPHARAFCFKNMEEVHNLSDIIGEIDDLVLQHSQKEFDDFPEESDSEMNLVDTGKRQKTDLNPPKSGKEDEPVKGHYRGISFGVNLGEECDLASEHNTETTDSKRSCSNGNMCYIKLLEDNNEVLKRSNEALVTALKEKDGVVNALKAQNEVLRKQQNGGKEKLQRLEAENTKLKEHIRTLPTVEKYQKLSGEYTNLLSRYDDLTRKFHEISQALRASKPTENRSPSPLSTKYHKFLNKSQNRNTESPSDSPKTTSRRPTEGSTTERKRASSKLRGFSDRNRQIMNDITKKVNGLILWEIKKEIHHKK